MRPLSPRSRAAPCSDPPGRRGDGRHGSATRPMNRRAAQAEIRHGSPARPRRVRGLPAGDGADGRAGAQVRQRQPRRLRRTCGPRSPRSAIATHSAGLRPTSCGMEPVDASAWSIEPVGPAPTSPWALRQAAETVEFLRIGPADARGPQPGRPAEAHPSPLTPGVQRVLGDPHLPGQIDHEPFIRAECGPIGLRRRLIAGRPPPHDQAHDVLVEMPGALGRAESLGVEPLGDGGERPALRRSSRMRAISREKSLVCSYRSTGRVTVWKVRCPPAQLMLTRT